MTNTDREATSQQRTAAPADRCPIDQSGSLSERWARDVWAAGAYESLAPTYFSMGGQLVERLGVDGEETVLDIGCGTGTVAITAARRGAHVTGIDIQPALLEHARSNAELAAVDIDWREGDATALPFEADSFDVTISNLGHMYADPPDRAARELVRVTRPGGQIGFTSWTPTSLYPALAGVVMAAVPPSVLPDYTEPPFLWGDPDTVRARLGDAVTDLAFDIATTEAPALSPAHAWSQLASASGQFSEIIDAVDSDDRSGLRSQLIDTVANYFDERANEIELEYQLATGTVRPA